MSLRDANNGWLRGYSQRVSRRWPYSAATMNYPARAGSTMNY